MTYSDKSITCLDCGQSFVFTADEQERYQQRGFLNEPKRCAPCRAARKEQRGGSRVSAERHSATCSECGRETSLPFRPRGDRPVYCNECYRSRRR